jgi:hypothetical protein
MGPPTGPANFDIQSLFGGAPAAPEGPPPDAPGAAPMMGSGPMMEPGPPTTPPIMAYPAGRYPLPFGVDAPAENAAGPAALNPALAALKARLAGSPAQV